MTIYTPEDLAKALQKLRKLTQKHELEVDIEITLRDCDGDEVACDFVAIWPDFPEHEPIDDLVTSTKNIILAVKRHAAKKTGTNP